MTDLALHIRPELARPSPYRWRRHPRRPGRPVRHEHAGQAPAWYAAALARLAAIPPQDYPDAAYAPAKRAVAGYAGVDPEQVAVGAGCDEILILCAQLALGRGERVAVARPTYQLYAVASRNAGGEVDAIEPFDGIGSTGTGCSPETRA